MVNWKKIGMISTVSGLVLILINWLVFKTLMSLTAYTTFRQYIFRDLSLALVFVGVLIWLWGLSQPKKPSPTPQNQ